MTIWQTSRWSLVVSRWLCQVVAVVLEAGGIGTPITVHFDKELEEDRFLEEFLNILAGLRTDTLERRTGAADEDAFLAFSLTIYHCIYADDFLLVFERLYFHFDGVRDFFVVVLEDLLADDLVDKESLGLVG